MGARYAALVARCLLESGVLNAATLARRDVSGHMGPSARDLPTARRVAARHTRNGGPDVPDRTFPRYAAGTGDVCRVKMRYERLGDRCVSVPHQGFLETILSPAGMEVARMADVLGTVTSPVSAYLLLLGLLIVDAFVPVIPTQAIMITGGALTAYGHLSLPTTIVVGAVGVIIGDWACYLLGRSTHHRTGPIARLRQRCGLQTDGVAKTAEQRGRARRAASKLTRGLREPGPVVILICRFVPGGRMARASPPAARSTPTSSSCSTRRWPRSAGPRTAPWSATSAARRSPRRAGA